MPYKELSHTADIRIKVYADSIPSLFRESLYALLDIMLKNLPSCKGLKKDSFSISSDDLDILIHDFLDEILYITLVLRRKICDFKIELTDNVLRFEYTYDILSFNEVKKEIKAITYHNLHIHKTNNRYETEVVMDV